MSDPSRILIIRPSALGDVCRTVPVLASLRAAFPQARIDWVVQDTFAPAIEAHPALNEVIRFPRERLARWWTSPARWWEMVTWFGSLRRRRYDLVLDCQGLGRSGLMAFATGAARRVGLRTARELAWLGYNLRLPHKKADPLPPHTVDQMLLLLEGVGVPVVRDMRLYVEPQHEQWWTQQRETIGLGDGPYAVLAPTSRWPSKRWPIDRFAQLVEPLYERGFVRVIVIGSPSESEQVRAFFDHFPPDTKSGRFVTNLVGATSIGQTMAVIAKADLVIANDSAPLHMAVGFDRPCVALFGPTEPAEVGPYGMDYAVVRGYVPPQGSRAGEINFKDPKLGDSLMRLISTTAVIQRIDRVLARASGAGRFSDQQPSAPPQGVLSPKPASTAPAVASIDAVDPRVLPEAAP